VPAPREQEPTEGLIYVNWVRYISSPYDLSLDVGYRADPGPPEEFPVRLVMSWEQAKILRLLLEDAVDGFEENVGPIREIGGGVVDITDQIDSEEEDS
jgi:hypothetical protein